MNTLTEIGTKALPLRNVLRSSLLMTVIGTVVFAGAAEAPPAKREKELNNIIKQLGNPDPSVCGEALSKLASYYLAIRMASGDVQEIVFKQQDVKLSEQAFQVLMIIGPDQSEATVDALRFYLINGNKIERARAAMLLGRLGPAAADAASDLHRMVRKKDDVALCAIRAMGLVGRDAEFAAPTLRKILGDEKAADSLRAEAARALGYLGDKRDEALLRESLLDKASVEVRAAAAGSIGELGLASEKTISALVTMVRAGNRRDRSSSLWALGHVGKRSMVAQEAVGSCLEDADALIRLAAIRAIRRMQPDSKTVVVRLLWIAAKDGLQANRREAIRAIVSIGDNAVPVVKKKLFEGEETLKQPAAECLGRISQGWRVLAEGLKHTNPRVQLPCSFGLRFVPAQWAKNCEGSVIEALKIPLLRANALAAIEEWKLHSSLVVNALGRFVRKPEEDGYAAIISVGILENAAGRIKEARELLLEATDSKDRAVSDAAKKALKALPAPTGKRSDHDRRGAKE